MRVIRFLWQMVLVVQPWPIKRVLLRHSFGYDLHPKARIGLSWIFPGQLIMGEGAWIGHLNVAINLDRMEMGDHASIGRRNWITGHPTRGAVHFQQVAGRKPWLVMGRHAAIMKNHHIDCTDCIEIGAFTTIAGYGSQLLTHGIDIVLGRQDCSPIRIGQYCLVGTAVVVVGGAELPDFCVVGAKALVRGRLEKKYSLYAGVPVKWIKPLPKEAAYFHRQEGYVI